MNKSTVHDLRPLWCITLFYSYFLYSFLQKKIGVCTKAVDLQLF